MELTYKATETGYTIFRDGNAWIVQNSYIPYPGDAMANSAKNHIDQILADNENPAREPVDPADEIEALKAENMEVKLALAEMAEAYEQSKLETQLALAELAEALQGGVE